VQVGRARIDAVKVQNNWRWCAKCQGPWFSGNPEKGPCPAGKNHDGGRSSKRTANLILMPVAAGQSREIHRLTPSETLFGSAWTPDGSTNVWLQ
jgi:hypothetical protein